MLTVANMKRNGAERRREGKHDDVILGPGIAGDVVWVVGQEVRLLMLEVDQDRGMNHRNLEASDLLSVKDLLVLVSPPIVECLRHPRPEVGVQPDAGEEGGHHHQLAVHQRANSAGVREQRVAVQ